MLNNTKVYLMRHGLDDASFIGGWSSGFLIDEGIKQVESATKFIFDNITDIEKIYHSGLNRAIQTSEIINRKLNLPIFYLTDLKELNKGKLNGLNVELAKKEYPQFFSKLLINQKYPDGESLQDLYNRVKVFLEKIENYDRCLLITHRGFINMLYFILNNVELNYDKDKFNVTHGSIHLLELKKIKRIY